MFFEELPTEVLSDIIERSSSRDFENLLLTSRTIFAAGRDHIRRHNELTRTWRHFDVKTSKITTTPLQFLIKLLEEPDIAPYVETVDFSGTYQSGVNATHELGEDFSDDEDDNDSDHSDDDDNDDDSDSNCEDEDDEDEEANPVITLAQETLIKSHLSCIKEVSLAGQTTDEWLSLLDLTTTEDTFTTCHDSANFYRAVLALLLLPNLTTLTLFEGWEETIFEHFSAPLDTFLSALLQTSTRPFPALTTLRPFFPPGPASHFPLDSLTPFLLIHSLRSVSLSSVLALNDHPTCGAEFHYNEQLFPPTLISNITTLELISSCINAKAISALLERMPNLEVFRYEHEAKWPELEEDWDQQDFLKAVMKSTSGKLKEVTITIRGRT